MTLTLHTLTPNRGARRSSRRIGRGHGSGRGTTAGRGTKGQRSRAGAGGGLRRLGVKQMLRSKAKIGGFRSLQPKAAVINLEVLEARCQATEPVTPELLKKMGLVPRIAVAVKILGGGKLTKKLTVKAHAFSASAKQAILDAGGSVEVIGPDKVQRKK